MSRDASRGLSTCVLVSLAALAPLVGSAGAAGEQGAPYPSLARCVPANERVRAAMELKLPRGRRPVVVVATEEWVNPFDDYWCYNLVLYLFGGTAAKPGRCLLRETLGEDMVFVQMNRMGGVLAEGREVLAVRGYTAVEWLFIVEVVGRAGPRPLTRVLFSECSKGCFRTGHGEILVEGLTTYHAAGYQKPRGKLAGHVMCQQRWRWDAAQGRFVGPRTSLDLEREEKLSLGAILYLPGAGIMLEGSEITDVRSFDPDEEGVPRKALCRFRPVGLLRERVPPELRDVGELEAVVDVEGCRRRRVLDLRPAAGMAEERDEREQR